MSTYRHFDGMCWPAPGQDLDDVAWRLVWNGKPDSDRLVAVSVITAFTELVRLPAKKRDAIIRELRKETR